jgi:hypothetical protein
MPTTPTISTSTIKSSHGADAATSAGFTFSGLSAKITSIDVSASAAQADVSHLGIAAGEKRKFKKAPLSDSPEVKVDFIGSGLPAVGTKGDFTLTGVFTATKSNLCTKAICTQASVKAAVGDLIKGSASFKLSVS